LYFREVTVTTDQKVKAEPDVVAIQFWLPRWVRDAFRDVCAAHQRTQSEMIRDFIREVVRCAGIEEPTGTDEQASRDAELRS